MFDTSLGWVIVRSIPAGLPPNPKGVCLAAGSSFDGQAFPESAAVLSTSILLPRLLLSEMSTRSGFQPVFRPFQARVDKDTTRHDSCRCSVTGFDTVSRCPPEGGGALGSGFSSAAGITRKFKIMTVSRVSPLRTCLASAVAPRRSAGDASPSARLFGRVSLLETLEERVMLGKPPGSPADFGGQGAREH